MHPLSATGLYWSIRGEVACDEHAPYADEPRWSTEAWEPLPVSSGRVHGLHYQCQHCATTGRAVVHNGHALH
jgi:hypothetical protein